MARKKRITDKVDKRYRAKLTIPGVEKPVYLSAKTKRELELKKQETIKRLITGSNSEDKPFVQIIVDWWNIKKRPRMTNEKSILRYRGLINNYLLSFFPNNQLTRAVSINDLQMCIDQFKGQSGSGCNITLTILRGAYRYAIALGIVDHDITSMIEPPIPSERKRKDFLTVDQTRRLLGIASRHEYGLTIMLLYYLGLRAGEMLALRWGDVDFDTNLIHVQRSITMNNKLSKGKTAAANRYVPIPAPLLSELKKHRNLPDNYIVTHPNSKVAGHMMSYSKFGYIWRDMMYKAGLGKVTEHYIEQCKQREAEGKPLRPPYSTYDLIPEITPHWLRHNYVSILYDAGVDAVTATRIVGHSSYQVTADIYTHISKERLKKMSVNLDGVFSKVAEKLPNGTSETTEKSPQSITL